MRLLLPLLLAGCATANPNLTPEQITAMVKDKSSTAICATIIAPAGSSRIVYVNMDETKVNSGTVQINPDTCAMTVTVLGQPAK